MKILLFLFIAWLGFRALFRYVLPGVMARKIKDFQDHVEQQQREQTTMNDDEGETRIIKEEGPQNTIGGNAGEFIDYEEID